MGISNDVITNRLDKKINYGFARTDFDSNKSIAAESLTSPIPNPSHNLWMDSDLIPTVPPLTNTSEVAVYKYNSNASQGSSVGDVEGVFEFTVDGTVQNKRSWLMHSTPGDTTTDILTDWIRVTYGAQYFPQFVVGPSGASGNTNLTPSNGYTPIFPVGVAGKEYYFDFEAGLLVFCGTTSPDTFIGSGDSVYMTSGYKYVGVKGFKNANWNSIVTIDYSQLSIPNTPFLSRISEVNRPNNNVDAANVHTLLFDVDSGFALDENNPGEITVRMESTFKTWKIYEDSDSLTSDDIIAQAVDTISLFGGNGIKLDAVTTTGNKSLTVNYDDNFIAPLADLALSADTLKNNEYEKFVTESGDNIMEENGDVTLNLASTVRIVSDLQTGAYYLDYTNFTNIPFGLANTIVVDNAIDTKVDKEFVENLNITSANSALLNDELPTYYLEYSNFTNTPQDLNQFTNINTNFQNATQVDAAIINKVDHNFINNLTGVDADTLGGSTSSTILSNFKQTTDLSEFLNITSDFQSAAEVEALIDKTHVDALGVDATHLEGEDGTFYLDYNQFSNTPGNLSDFTNDTNFQNAAEVEALINKPHVDALLVNAAQLNGKDENFYRDYNNLNANVPFIPTNIGSFTEVDSSAAGTGLANSAVLLWISDPNLPLGGSWKPSTLQQVSPGVFSYQNYATTFANLIPLAGSGSGWDADKLDAQEGTYYLNYLNFTNTPQDLSDFTNLFNFANTSQVSAAITTTVNKAHVDALGINATHLEGEDGTFYLDYNQFSNTPGNLSDFTNDTNFQNAAEVNAAINAEVTNGYINNLNGVSVHNATQLNNQPASFYLDYNNLNANVPTALSDFSNDLNFQNITQVNASIDARVTASFINNLPGDVDADKVFGKDKTNLYNFLDGIPQGLQDLDNTTTNFQNPTQVEALIDKTHVDALGINAATLEGEDKLFYLDYNQFSNTPGNLSDFTNDTNFQNVTEVEALIDSTVTSAFINLRTVNADQLNGFTYQTLLTNFKQSSDLREFLNTTSFANTTQVEQIIDKTHVDLLNVDAFTLNTFTATDLLDWNNFNNIPNGVSYWTNDSGYQTLSDVTTTIDKSHVDALGINATELNGQNSNFYRDYNNLNANVPTALSDFSNDLNLQDATDVDAAIIARVNKSYVNALGIDATHLNGRDESNLYGFLQGRPVKVSDLPNDANYQNATQVTNLIDKTHIDAQNVDAVTLSGKPLSYVLDYGNILFTPRNVSYFTNDAGYQTPSDVLTLVDKAHIDAQNVDADTLDNRDSAFYRDYNNLNANVPTDVSHWNNDANYATESYVDTKVTDLIDAAPTALDTLNELAASLNDDANFASTITNELATKADVSVLGDIDARKFKNIIKFRTQSGDIIVMENGDVTLNLTSDDIIMGENTSAEFSDFYLDYTNFTNTPQDLSEFTNLFHFSNTIQVDTAIDNKVDATYVEGLGVDPANLSISADDLTNIDLTNPPTPGQALVWHGGDQAFIPGDVASSGGGSSSNFSGSANTIPLGSLVTSEGDTDYGSQQLQDGASVLISDQTNITEAFDILNETLLNIRNQTYVRDAIFNKSVTSDESGHTGHFHSPVTVSFDSSVADTTSTSLTHSWEFEHSDSVSGASGATQYDSAANPTHTWTQVGTFKVTHTLTAGGARFPGSAGSFSKHIDYVTVTPPLPIPQFNVNITPDVRQWNGFNAISLDGGGTSCTFTNTSQNSNRFMWDMGDGTVYPTGALENDPLGNSGTAWTSVFDITHTFSGSVDEQFTVKLHAFHTDHSGSASDHCISEIKTNYISGYVPVTPTFTFTTLQGNNQAPEDNVTAGNANLEGHKVDFTDTTVGLGSGFGQSLQWQFSADAADGTNIQSPSGSTGQTSPATLGGSVTRYFKRDNTSAPATISYEVKLLGINGHSSSPFESTGQMVIVDKDPRADFTYTVVNNPSGHSSYSATNIGFNFIGYDGLNYGEFQFTDASENADSWDWDYNDDGTSEASGQSPSSYIYNTPGTYSVSLIASGPTSETATDDTETKNNIIIINPAPTAPSGLTGKTISLPSSEGISPAICATTTDNSGGSMPSAGTSVRRIIDTTVDSSILSGFANMFPSNGNNSGTLNSFINGSVDSSIAFTTSTNVGTTGSLEITAEQDANVSSPSTYPLNFYKQYKAKISKANSPGYNTYQLTHSDGTSSNEVGWVQDDLTDVPTCLNYGVAENTANYRYMSGIPYYNSGSSVDVTGLQLINITGQTYNSSGPFITVDSGGAGTALTTQTFDYTAGLGSAIPNAGLISATNINNLTVNLNGSGVGIDVLKIKSKNVNGESAFKVDNQEIKYWFSSPSIDETNMTAFSSVLKRVDLGSTGATPSYTASDFVSTSAWNSQTSTIVGTDEAVVLPDGINHDETDYSSFLPVGPNYSSGRSGTQYFTVGFNKPQLSKFGINLTGEITSMHIALPGTDLDTTSGLSGWFDASQVIGGGKPGSNGGNGSDAIGQAGNNAQLNQSGTQVVGINFGTWNSSKPGNQNNCILIRIGIASGKSVTALSVTNAP